VTDNIDDDDDDDDESVDAANVTCLSVPCFRRMRRRTFPRRVCQFVTITSSDTT